MRREQSIGQALQARLLALETIRPVSLIKLGLERITRVVEVANLKHWSCPVITVGGTNGKGSCIKLLERIYVESGYRVAATVSPHLDVINERFSLSGRSVSDEVLLGTFEAVDRLEGVQDLTYYEYLILSALWLFRVYAPDVLLLEVGLGGRLDAVNVIDADVALISSIGLDHCDRLGDTREAIAREKSGIFRPKGIAISGDLNPPQSLLFQACALSTTFFQYQRDFFLRREKNHCHWQGPSVSWSHLPLPPVKTENAASSLMAVSALQARLPVREPAIAKAFSEFKFPGRFERYHTPYPIILDVAHNQESCEFLAEQLRALGAWRCGFIFAAMVDKPIPAMLAVLERFAVAWLLVDLNEARAMSKEALRDLCSSQSHKPCYTFANMSEAMGWAIQAVNHGSFEQIVVCGSFRTVAACRAYLKQALNQEILV